jgi:hypothetical protein
LLIACCSPADAKGVTPFAEVLIWQPSAETSTVWSSVVNANTFEAANLDFGWNAGFRAGLNMQPAEALWDFNLSVTHFATSQTAFVPEGGHLVLPEFFSGFVSGDGFAFTSAGLDWSLNYTNFDLEAGHRIALSESLEIRPAFGIRAAVINQTIDSRWADSLLGLTAVENVQHDFFGIGPSAGLGARWTPVEHFSLVGECSGALMYGVWNVSDDFRRTDGGAPLLSYEAFSTSMNDATLGTVMIRSFFGFEWTIPSRFEIVARVGYEVQWWANQQRLLTFQQLPMHGDLTFQGGTCGVVVCF